MSGHHLALSLTGGKAGIVPVALPKATLARGRGLSKAGETVYELGSFTGGFQSWLLTFQFPDFLDSGAVPGGGGCRSGQKCACDISCVFGSHEACSHAKDIGVVVLSSEAGADWVFDQCCPDTRYLVGGNAHADAAPAEE